MHLVRTQNFPKNQHFLPPGVRIGVKNIIFGEIFRTYEMNDPLVSLFSTPAPKIISKLFPDEIEITKKFMNSKF